MALRLPSLKLSALVVAGLVAAYLLLSWLVLPPVLQAQSERFFAEKTGHRLTMDRPEFNPFELSLRLTNLHLVQPGGEPLLAFRELVVDLSAASIFRGAFVLDGIRLDGLEATVADFYTILFDRLRNKVVVGDERLLALAKARGEATARALKAAGAPAERVAILAAEKVEAEGPTVPVKLGLGAAAKSALLPSAGATAN